jgi:hypothetical protein
MAAKDEFDAVFDVVSALFNHPAVTAAYAAEGKRLAEKDAAEAAAAKVVREADEARKAKDRAYDVWALNGGANECIQFGINAGCAPECPVFMRGECEMQAENEALFSGDVP